jgi:uncharacterized protein YbbC (DUF1343 family)
MAVQFGIDNILNAAPNWKKLRIALLTNDAAKTSKGILSRLALIENGFHIVQLFSPEHGIDTNGVDGAKITNGNDPITQLPITSLYGDQFMPSQSDLEHIDVLLFDIPDAGTRFYTYLWSMTYWIQAASKFNKRVIILDRPNPLGGAFNMVEGPLLQETEASFIGRFPIPIKHQCTLGELALYFNQEQQWNAALEIIKCSHWERSDLFFEWQLPWVRTSPALQNFEACILYPGLCLFEATNVSVGRGTRFSFEWIGAEWFNLPALAMVWQNMLKDEIQIETMPLEVAVNGSTKLSKGIRIKVIDPSTFHPVMLGMILLKFVRDLHPNDFKWMPYPTQANPTGNNHLSLLLGIPNAENLFDQPLQVWLQHVTRLLKVNEWKAKMHTYLLY